MQPRSGRTLWEALWGAIAFVGALVTPFLRRRRLRWGATDAEIEALHPGDALVPAPMWSATHAIDIAATPRQVWPWIAQLGQGRGGFYSYEKLENLAGCQIRNATRVLEEHQGIEVGDPVRLHVDAPPMTAAIVDPDVALVLYGHPGEGESGPKITSTWALLLVEQPDGSTRLLSRTRYEHGEDLRSKLLGGPLLIEPVSFVMERKMLRVIKAQVESSLPLAA